MHYGAINTKTIDYEEERSHINILLVNIFLCGHEFMCNTTQEFP